MIPKFRARELFELPDRKLFVLAGTVVEGDIQPGMFLLFFHARPPLDLWSPIRIGSIEKTQHEGTEELRLCLEPESDEERVILLDGRLEEFYFVGKTKTPYWMLRKPLNAPATPQKTPET